MPTYTEEWVMAQWIYSTLNVSAVTTLAVGGVHRGFVPPSTTTHPYISFTSVPSQNSDLYAMNSQPLVQSRLTWDILVIGTSLQGEVLNKVSAIIFGLLNGKSATVSSGKINSCRRVGLFTQSDFDEAEFITNVSSYIITAKAL